MQLSVKASGSVEMFLEPVKTQDINQNDNGGYTVTVPNKEVPRFKVAPGNDGSAHIVLHAWKGQELLGQWTFGQVQGLGYQG